MGTGRPWALALGQVVPILMAAYFLSGFEVMAPSAPSPWLFFMTILSILAGAIASMAATRSRRLWLRTPWTRRELFRRVEKALWGHNSFALGVLLIMFVVLGSHAFVPTNVLVFGMGLLMLGIALSTYLGMMMTAPGRLAGCGARGCGDAGIDDRRDVRIQAAMPATAVARSRDRTRGSCPVFRIIAQRRWTHLDWMRCRADGDVRAAA